ncbi:adenylate kinase [Fasciola gigantica]|uniref:Adenylate kinase n=1 Tax=Fasciola gigantica TaxID=46835 RepID=A0A504YHW5_FASGI|nr:adenylate kinase [Fasciola gigantica]
MTEKIYRKRVFLANADRYDEFYLGKRLTEAIIGSAVSSEDVEQMEEDEGAKKNEKTGENYEIYATLSGDSNEKPEFVKDIIKCEKRRDLYNGIAKCDYIIYNIKDDEELIDEAMWILDQLHENMATFSSQKMFILISTMLTWVKSSPLDESDPEMPFTDDDYARRKAHRGYLEHLKAEKTTVYLGKTEKTKLLTYVIATGVTYGEKQNVFHWFFKQAWNNAPMVTFPGDGQNIVPTIHVYDLASIVQTVMELRPTKHYILAKDESQNTLQEIVKAIAKGMSTGKTKAITRDEAFLTEDLTQSHIDQLLINLRMDASFIREQGTFRWHCENGILEEIGKLLREFKLARQLIPIRLCVLGPPVSGKSTLARRLCEHYKLHHVHIKGVIDEMIAILKKRAEADMDVIDPPSKMTNQASTEEEEDVGPAGATELLETIQQSMEDNNGRLDLDLVSDFFRQKLNSKPCQNQGFVIDGYPKSKKQASALFSGGGGEDEEEEDEGNEMDEGGAAGGKESSESGPSPAELFARKYLASGMNLDDICGEPGVLPTQPVPVQLPKGLLPDYVFELQASDQFLRERVIHMPENKVHGTHYTEAGLLRRLTEYRTNQIGINPTLGSSGGLSVVDTLSVETEPEQTAANPMSPLASASIQENSVRAYFDAKGVLQIPIDVMSEESEDMENTARKIIHFIGQPRNYGLTPEERNELERKLIAERLERERVEKERMRSEAEAEMKARKKRQEEWSEKHEKLVQEETDILNKEAEPLRVYLRKNVMPVLASGLMECVRQRPEDPIDFLAEYLFFNNPQTD